MAPIRWFENTSCAQSAFVFLRAYALSLLQIKNKLHVLLIQTNLGNEIELVIIIMTRSKWVSISLGQLGSKAQNSCSPFRRLFTQDGGREEEEKKNDAVRLEC